jgi:hypothetical protein
MLVQGRQRGDPKLVLGYWGDVVSSPFWGLGTFANVPAEKDVGPTAHRCASGLFDVNNRHSGSEQFRHNCAQVAVLNVMAWLWELENGRPYAMRVAHDIYSGLGGELDSEVDVSVSLPPERRLDLRAASVAAGAVARARHVASAFERMRLVPMGGNLEHDLRLSRFRETFDGVVVGCRGVQLMESANLRHAMKPRGFAVVESARNLPVFGQAQKDEFDRRALDLLGRAGFVMRGSERSFGTDKYGIGSISDVRSKERRERDAAEALAALREDEGLRDGWGDHAEGLSYARRIRRWDAKRGDNPRPECLVFEWDASLAEERRVSLASGPAGEALRTMMLETPAERERREEDERLERRKVLAREIPDETPPETTHTFLGAGSAWSRGGYGKRVTRFPAESDAPSGDGASSDTANDVPSDDVIGDAIALLD